MRNDEGRGHKHNEGRRATDIQCGELVSLVGGGDMRDRAVPLAAVADELRVRVPENGQCGGDHDDMLGWMLAGRVPIAAERWPGIRVSLSMARPIAK